MRLYRAENLKFRHTVTGKLWILMQTLTLLLAYGISRGNGISSAYNWWYTLMLPGMVTLSACMIGEKDRKGKNRAVLSLPSSPGKVWDAKILVGMKTLLLANLLGAAATLWQIPLCLWMSQKWGFLPALILNMILNGSGPLAAVTPYWILDPWAILPRLMTGIIGILPNGLPAMPGSMTYTPGITDNSVIIPGVMVMIAWLAVLWGLSRFWYERKGAQTV